MPEEEFNGDACSYTIPIIRNSCQYNNWRKIEAKHAW
jgi:hypothetical protein